MEQWRKRSSVEDRLFATPEGVNTHLNSWAVIKDLPKKFCLSKTNEKSIMDLHSIISDYIAKRVSGRFSNQPCFSTKEHEVTIKISFIIRQKLSDVEMEIIENFHVDIVVIALLEDKLEFSQLKIQTNKWKAIVLTEKFSVLIIYKKNCS
jgi:hypothetical protein